MIIFCLLTQVHSQVLSAYCSHKSLMVLLYNRCINAPYDLISHLEFTYAEKDTIGDGRLKHVAEARQNADDLQFLNLFKQAVIHYLNGLGHPNHPFVQQLLSCCSGHLPLQRRLDDQHFLDALRSRLLLYGALGSTLVPSQPTWIIEVSSAFTLILSCLI